MNVYYTCMEQHQIAFNFCSFPCQTFSWNSANVVNYTHIFYMIKLLRHLLSHSLWCVGYIMYNFFTVDVKQSTFSKTKIDVSFMHRKVVNLSYFSNLIKICDISCKIFYLIQKVENQ